MDKLWFSPLLWHEYFVDYDPVEEADQCDWVGGASIKSFLFYPCCTSTVPAPVPTAVVFLKNISFPAIYIAFTQTPETPSFCAFILPEYENVQYRQRSLLPRKCDSLTDFLFIADLRVTSRRPCWWSRTKAFLSCGN